ncbi:juvenile hormone esterase-like isoform X1 [Helicoverpa zea]|uniref:juvenile hormone esterase-like isoform X1 n=1 Tax=Helicoverpa zea TaxID=7113 RepID=UPI001F56F3FD|nr:juvenile hormone esterase-like isoform X1 [Helicoverpa zea]
MKCGKRIVLFTLFAMNLVDQPAPEVTIEQGTLSGKISTDGSFFEYVGIPYATTNSSTRFKAPFPPPSWSGVYKAVDEIHQCPQSSLIGIVGTEDCLKINVYVPSMAKTPLPVMVYIHGGAFLLGSGGKFIYAPDFLVNQDVIVVTFNYRLGALGFLCLGIKEAPGNAGIKDQIAALRWVKKNIAAFGGDLDNVTLFGQSAGATSASLLLASKATEGLFHKVIIQSGSSISSWAINRQPLWVASLIAKELGYNTKDPKEIYEIFSKLPYEKLIKAKPKKPLGMYFDTQLLNYPCVEQEIEGEEAVITDYPFNIFESNPKNIPVIYGTTSREGIFLLPDDTEESLAARNARYIFASDLEFPSEEEASKVSKMAREFYFKEKNISFEVHSIIIDLNTQLYFEVPAILESETLIKNNKANMYNYYFNYAGGRNFLKFIAGFRNEPGACHSDEILYVFKGNIWPFPINNNDKKVIEKMTKMWSNFAKYGDPTPTNDLLVKWEPSTKDQMKFLYIDEDLKMGPIPNQEAYQLWKNIYEKYRKKHTPNDFQK